MTRTHWILAGLLLAQAALLALCASTSERTVASAPRVLLPALAASTPARIEITGTEGKSIELERADGAWRLPQADGFPADAAKVDELLKDLRELKVRRPVVSTARYHAALKVTPADKEQEIRVWPEKGAEPEVDLLVGSSPNYGIHHVRLASENEVYEVRGLQPYEMRPESAAWIDRKLLDVPAEEVSGLKLRNANGEIELTKSDGTWRIAGDGEADPTKVDTFVRGIVAIMASEPAGRADRPEFGLGAPAARVELTRTVTDPAKPAEPGVLELGAEVPGGEGKRYARRGGATHAAIVSSWDVEKIANKKVADLRK